VRIVFDHQVDYSSHWKAIESIAAELSITHETAPHLGAAGRDRRGEASGSHDRGTNLLRNLQPEVKELRRANEIVKAASAFFRGARRPTLEIVASVDAHPRFGVQPICRVLSERCGQIAPNTY
jgi:transposase-like protein